MRVCAASGRLAALLILVALCDCSGGGMNGTTMPPGGTPPPTPSSGTDILTYKYDLARSGANLTESVLTPANVNSGSFGQLRMLAADGKVDAQPLYLSGLTVAGATHNVVFVATENDSLYAFDADTGSVLWHVSLLGSGESPSDDVSCEQVTPQIGITSTPVIDRTAGAHGIIYAVAMSKTTGTSTYHQRLYALDVTTGAGVGNSPMDIEATYPVMGGTMTFDPMQYEERAALLLSQGTIYTSWTSHCDHPPYSGWVIAYDQATLSRSMVYNAAPNSGGAGPAIWMAGGGPAADAAGNVYLLTANGAFETTLNTQGFPSQSDYGNSFLKLAPAGSLLSVADYFTMYNEVDESNNDQDLGSGGVLLLPDLVDGMGTTRHLAVGAGKDGSLYVVNRDSMGHFNPSNNSQIWQELTNVLAGGVWSTPAYFSNAVYYAPVNGYLTAFTISGARLSVGGHTSTNFAYPGSSPAISANGTANGIVWAHENISSGAPGVLHAYDAADLTHELYNSSQAGTRDQFGPGNKFITPAIADGKVFVGTQSGVAVFGLLN